MAQQGAGAPVLDVAAAPPTPLPPLSWPPPGLEPLQGKLWRVTLTLWAGSVLLVLPLLWALAVEQPFWSLGPFEGNWQIGLGIGVFSIVLVLLAFASLVQLLREGAHAADQGYGVLTVLEVAADLGRDTGFLVQGRRYFSALNLEERTHVVSARLTAVFLALAAAIWMAAGFAISVLMAARGRLSSTGMWIFTLAPTAALLGASLVVLGIQGARIAVARRRWSLEAGQERVRDEVQTWQRRLSIAGPDFALGGGALHRGRDFRRAAIVVGFVMLLVLVPTLTVVVSSAVGPILAYTSVPTFLSVQEMAGAAEVLRQYRLGTDATVPPQAAGEALQNLAFVGPGQRPEAGERAPRAPYEEHWFDEPDVFPDPFSESVGADLIASDFATWSPEQAASLRRAATHPAQVDFERLARAPLADVITARWTIPFPNGVTIFTLPWPRFTGLRAAGIAHVAQAAVELSEGQAAAAEETIREVISAGFLLVDEGPTLVDNLTGVQLIDLGGDALEAIYARTGRATEAEQLHWTRESAATSARRSRVGISEQDIHTLLRGIPDLVEREDALRGLRWEYLATFNLLAPCINLHKMVFGPDETYEGWIGRSREHLVRVPGEAALFDLARSGAGAAAETGGLMSRFLTLTLGGEARPGSCAALIQGLESGTALP